jgi:hypothetical protein
MKVHCLLLAASTALQPLASNACEYLTQHFELCSEGTPWATGRWENGGDSATLYVGDIGYEGFENYLGYDLTQPMDRQLQTLFTAMNDGSDAKVLQQDRLASSDLALVRVIFDRINPARTDERELRVAMIAEAAGARIMLDVIAPPDTSLADVERLSRAYVALVQPRAPEAGN